MTPHSPPEPVQDDELAELDRILAARAIRSAYQPLVELDTGAVVAYEALARGPVGTPLERPDRLFAAARRARRLTDLDVACRAAAISGARAAGLAEPYRLFVNVEPEALDGWRPEQVPGGDGLPLTVVVELTERALAARPAELLQVVSRIRERGWGVALDDVGAVVESLALLPLLRPDVIKLDLALVQRRATADIAAVMNAVHAEAERSGTVVLAEGLETEAHVQTARAFGATLGQGWLFGRPGPLPAPVPPLAGRPVQVVPRADAAPDASPFELAAACRAPRAATKPLLVEVSKQLEAQARHAGDAAVVLATFQDARFFTPATRRRYADLARHTAFVGALGEGMPAEPVPGVRGAVLRGGDPLLGEWDIAVLGPHFAATLVARDLGDTGPDAERRFDFVLSHDRELTIAVANALMSRIWPEPRTVDLPRLPGGATVVGPRAPEPPPAQEAPAAARTTAASAALAGVPPSLLRRAVAAVSTGLVIADVRQSDQPLVWVNEAFTRLSGYRPEDVLGRNCRFLQGASTDPVAVAAMRQAIAEGREVRTRLRNYRRDGSSWWNEVHLCPVRDATGTVTHYIGEQDDVTAQVEAEERVLHLAYHDQLTGLPNRARLADLLPAAIERTRVLGTATALLFIDLDDFKAVNDELGHTAGDALLRMVSRRLRSAVRADDTLVRQGGDELLLLLSDVPVQHARSVTARVAEQVLEALAEPFRLAPGVERRLHASIGVSIAPLDSSSADELLGHADSAMYDAKRRGGHRVHHFA